MFARLYDLDVGGETADVAMYKALASASDGPVLELACGTGRICVELAWAGHQVVGVDRDAFMLERADRAWQAAHRGYPSSSRHGSLELVQADMTTVRLGRRFDLVILAFNSLLLLHGAAARRRTFETIRRHLTSSGRAVVDVSLPAPEDLELYDGRMISEWVRLDEESGSRVSKSTIATYDEDAQLATVDTIYEIDRDGKQPRRVSRRDQIQFVTHDELVSEVHASGLQTQALLGDYSMSEYAPESGRLIVIAAPSALDTRPCRTTRRSPLSLL